MAVETVAHGLGRRKTSVARVYIRKGEAKISVNGKSLNEFFPRPEHQDMINAVFTSINEADKHNIFINVRGGGVSGQAGACVHGLARAFEDLDSSNRSTLKANGFLRRDPRMVERKKYGQPGARKKFQFSKR